MIELSVCTNGLYVLNVHIRRYDPEKQNFLIFVLLFEKGNTIFGKSFEKQRNLATYGEA